MAEKAIMALHDTGDKIELPGGYYLKKTDDDRWQIGGPLGNIRCDLGFHVTSNVGIGKGGSIDSDIVAFAAAMNSGRE